MLRVGFRRQHLIEAVRWDIDYPLGRREYLASLGKSRAHPDHVRRHLEHDGRLLPVGGAPVDLGPLLPVTACQEKRDRRRKLALALLLRDLDVSGVELPVSVGLEYPEYVADDLLLPRYEVERLARPGTFRMGEALYEVYGIVRSPLVIMRVLRLEGRRDVFHSLSHCIYTCSAIFAIITGGTLIPHTYCTLRPLKS